MITLKPQWTLQETPAGVFLTSENAHNEVIPESVPLLMKLVDGVEAADLDDEEFSTLEAFSSLGYLTIVDEPDAPFWELGGSNYNSVKEQLKHVTFFAVDLTSNQVGSGVCHALVNGGMVASKTQDTAVITLLFSESLKNLPEHPGTVLPIICNRVRVTVGPLVFKQGSHISDLVQNSAHYPNTANYKLPEAADALQRAWITMAVLNLVATAQLRPANHILELNLARLEFNQWPV